MKVNVQADGKGDEAIPDHSDQVHTQEKHEEKILLLSMVGVSQEEEFRDGGLVSLMHISADLKKGTQGLLIPTRNPNMVPFGCSLCRKVGTPSRLKGNEGWRKIA